MYAAYLLARPRGTPRGVASTAVLLIAITAGAVHSAEVVFDAPSLIAARPLEEGGSQLGETLYEIELPISTLQTAGKTEQIRRLQIEMRFGDRGVRVVDFSPRAEFDQEIEGAIAVEQVKERTNSFDASVAANLPLDLAVANVKLSPAAGGGASNRNSTKESFTRLPTHEHILAAGTLHRGRGVFFKMTPTPRSPLEGQKEFAVRFAAPREWTHGPVLVRCFAEQKPTVPGFGDETAGEFRGVVGLYLAGDAAAREAAQEMLAGSRRTTVHTANKAPTKSRPTDSRHWAANLFRPRRAVRNAKSGANN